MVGAAVLIACGGKKETPVGPLPVEPLEVSEFVVDVPEWGLSPWIMPGLRTGSGDLDSEEVLTYRNPTGFGQGAGFLPLPLRTVVHARTWLRLPSGQVESLLIRVGELVVHLTSQQLLPRYEVLAEAQGPFNLRVGPFSKGDGVFSEFPVDITIDTGALTLSPYLLEIRAYPEEKTPFRRWLYFSPVLDAVAVAWETESILWVGTNSQGLLRLDLGADLTSEADDTFLRVLIPGMEPSRAWGTVAPISSLHLVPEGNVWVGHGLLGGVSLVDLTGNVLSRYKEGYTGPVLGFQEVGQGLVASVGLAWGVAILDSSLTRVRSLRGLPDGDTSGVAMDANGYVWVSTFDISGGDDLGVDGVAVFDAGRLLQMEDPIAVFGGEAGLWDSYLTGVYVDADHLIWLPGDKGIHVLDYGIEPVDRSDDRWTTDPRFKAASDLIFMNDRRVLIANGFLSVVDHAGTPFDRKDDTLVRYDRLEYRATGMRLSRGGLLAVTPCSGKRVECVWQGDLNIMPPESPLVVREADDGSGHMAVFSPCWGLSFVRFGPDAGRTDDDEVWDLYTSRGVYCRRVS